MPEAKMYVRRNVDTGETVIRITTSTRAGHIFRYDRRKLAPVNQIIKLMKLEIPLSNTYLGTFEEEEYLNAFLERMKETYRVAHDAVVRGIVSPDVPSDVWCSRLWKGETGPNEWLPPLNDPLPPQPRMLRERDDRTGESRISIADGGQAGKIFVTKDGVYQYTLGGKDIAQQMAMFPAKMVAGKKYLSSVAELVLDDDEYERFIDEVRESFEASRDAVDTGEFAHYLKQRSGTKHRRIAPRIQQRRFVM